MKKIVILGCENSHANSFLRFIRDEKKFADVQVLGVYSEETEASKRLSEEFGVNVMNSLDEYVDQVDGVVITARHGDNHYKYAKPYLKRGVPTFIDKPITCSESEAVEFMNACISNGVKITGGSCLKHASGIKKIKQEHVSQENGKTLSAIFRAPVSITNAYGNFYFYSQHLVEMVLESLGRYPKSVLATKNGNVITTVFKYADFDVTGIFIDGSYIYSATIFSTKGESGGIFDVDDKCFYDEFDEFYQLLCGEEQKISYKDFISPVFVINAIMRSLESEKEETIKEINL